jgi:hypothetical protein
MLFSKVHNVRVLTPPYVIRPVDRLNARRRPAAAGDEAPTGHDSVDTQDSSATGGGRSSAQPPDEVTPTTPRKAFGLRTKSKTPKQQQQLVDDSTLLVRGSPAASTATSPQGRFRASQPAPGVKSPPSASGRSAAAAAPAAAYQQLSPQPII